MRTVRVASLGLVAALLALLAAPPVEGASAARASSQVELYYSLTAEIASTTFDARVEAGARLLMERSDDGRQLSLVRPLEPAWKFYRVDPLGPGGEAKMAAVVTLPEASWSEVEAARQRVESDAAERWAGWRREGLDGGQSLDGSFAFLVLGPAKGRFEVELAPDGRAKQVTNRLTDSWLSAPLDSLLERWRRATDGVGRPPLGYWFWNAESKPFAWEPHTYHALVSALRLMEAPYLPASGAASASPSPQLPPAWERSWPELATRLAEVLAVLTPKARGRLRPRGSASATVEFAARSIDEHRWAIAGEVVSDAGGKGQPPLRGSRQLIYDAERQTAVADSLVATMETKSGRVTLRVGFKPVESSSPAQR